MDAAQDRRRRADVSAESLARRAVAREPGEAERVDEAAKEFGSEKAWLWGASGFLFGIIPLPFLAYCYEAAKSRPVPQAEAPTVSKQPVPQPIERTQQLPRRRLP